MADINVVPQRALVQEDLSTHLDGLNTNFNLKYEPIEGSLILYINGLAQSPNFYILNGKLISIDYKIKAGRSLVARYERFTI